MVIVGAVPQDPPPNADRAEVVHGQVVGEGLGFSCGFGRRAA